MSPPIRVVLWAGAAGRGATAFGGKVLATGMGLPSGFGGGAFGATSLSAGAGVFFLTAAVISKTFQALDTKEPHRPERAPVTVFPAKPRLYRPPRGRMAPDAWEYPRDEAFFAADLAQDTPPKFRGTYTTNRCENKAESLVQLVEPTLKSAEFTAFCAAERSGSRPGVRIKKRGKFV